MMTYILLLKNKKTWLLSYFLFLAFGQISMAQQATSQTPHVPPQTYPRIAGYVGIVHPLVAFASDGTHANFDDSYTVGMPTSINIWKSSKVGFSLEMVPFIRAENGISKMNNFLFHPGILAALGHGFTFVGRAAFETSGRYGVTPVLNKVVKKNKYSNYFVAIPFPVRFGNDRPASFGAAFQFGLGF